MYKLQEPLKLTIKYEIVLLNKSKFTHRRMKNVKVLELPYRFSQDNNL